jgi:hypothetical protein
MSQLHTHTHRRWAASRWVTVLLWHAGEDLLCAAIKPLPAGPITFVWYARHLVG